MSSLKLKKGFTLVELLIVITIMAVLSLIGYSVYSGIQKHARDTVRRSDIDSLAAAYEDGYNVATQAYTALSATQFSAGVIPTGPSGSSYTGSSYTYVDGPNASTPNTQAYKICVTLESGSAYCRVNQQGTPSTIAYVPGAGGGPNPVFTDLLAYWKMDETSGTSVADSKGTYTGTATNATIVTGASAKIGNARSFSGSNQYISDGTSLSITNGTISAWVYPTSVSGLKTILAKDGAGINAGDISLELLGSRFQLKLVNGAADVTVINSTDVSANSWSHVVATFGSAGVKLYVNNGNPTTNSSYTAGGTNTNATLNIGVRRPADLPDYFAGRLDEIGIWNRVLSAAEVSTLYNSGSGLTYTP